MNIFDAIITFVATLFVIDFTRGVAERVFI